MSQEKIIQRMKVLLAMSEGTANENEAMVAAKRLHAMLAKHNLSIIDLSAEENPIEKDQLEVRNKPWKRTVGGQIARLYFCSFYYTKLDSRRATFTFVGTEANRAFAMSIFKLVVATIERESRTESRRIYGKKNASFITSFLTGAHDRIYQRCKELIEAARHGDLQDEDGNTLPVLASAYDTAKQLTVDWIDDNVGGLRRAKVRLQARNAAGYNKGTEAGNRVALSRSIHGQQQKLIGG